MTDQSIAVLYKGGRLPSWELLSPDQQAAYSQEHVDLMLSVASEHRMTRLEGYKLLQPVADWQRFWVIEFPTANGAEEWVEKEMAPHYGLYGYYEYYLSRPWGRDRFDNWATMPLQPRKLSTADPREPHALGVDMESVVALTLERWRPGAEAAAPKERGDQEHEDLLRAIARKHGLMRLEAFRLMAPQWEWHEAWLAEFPTIDGAQAWTDAQSRPARSTYRSSTSYLTRRWSPEYFATWVPR